MENKIEYGKPQLYQGQAVEIEIKDGKYAGRYFSRVRSVGSKVIEIDVPRVGGVLLPVTDNLEVTVRYAERRTSCVFRDRIKVTDDQSGNRVYRLLLPRQVEKKQLRKYARAKTVESLTYKMITSPEIMRRARYLQEVPGKTYEGHFIDISGAGAKVKSRKRVDLGAELMLAFKLPLIDAEFSGVTGKVIKADVIDHNEVFVVEWIGITEPERQDLIQFVYQCQIRMRRRGLSK